MKAVQNNTKILVCVAMRFLANLIPSTQASFT